MKKFEDYLKKAGLPTREDGTAMIVVKDLPIIITAIWAMLNDIAVEISKQAYKAKDERISLAIAINKLQLEIKQLKSNQKRDEKRKQCGTRQVKKDQGGEEKV